MTVTTTRRILAWIGCGAALSMAALSPAPQAHATPLSFIQALNDNGIVVYDTASALTTGYSICDALNEYNGAEIAEELYTGTSYTEVPTREVAAAWVVVSVHELCPQHDHSGRVRA